MHTSLRIINCLSTSISRQQECFEYPRAAPRPVVFRSCPDFALLIPPPVPRPGQRACFRAGVVATGFAFSGALAVFRLVTIHRYYPERLLQVTAAPHRSAIALLGLAWWTEATWVTVPTGIDNYRALRRVNGTGGKRGNHRTHKQHSLHSKLQICKRVPFCTSGQPAALRNVTANTRLMNPCALRPRMT